jgi:hypothetical protein
VVDSGGRVVGIVSEGDLLHRAEIGTARRHRVRRRSWWLDHFAADQARDYIKSHGRTVKDIMTRDVVAVTEDTDLGDVAALLEARRVKRVPVMRDGKIVGIISRANLVRALGATKAAKNGRRSGRRTLSSATAWCISGSLRTNPKRKSRRCGSRRRSFPASAGSRNTSSRPPPSRGSDRILRRFR